MSFDFTIFNRVMYSRHSDIYFLIFLLDTQPICSTNCVDVSIRLSSGYSVVMLVLSVRYYCRVYWYIVSDNWCLI